MADTHTSPTKTIPLIITALSLAIALHALSADSLWGDEIFTAIFANQSLPNVINWTAGDIHPPLYYLLAGNFSRVIIPPGTTQLPNQISDWLWRFPSVLFTVLTVAVTYRLARSFACRTGKPGQTQTTAVIALLLLALAPIAVKYAQEARMHALFMFLSALSTWLLFRALAQPRLWTRWLAFALAAAANIYTMYFGFLILTAQGAYVLFLTLSPITPHRKARLASFTAATLLAFLLYLPWWPVLFDILRRRAAVGAIEGGVGNPLTFLQGVVRALGPTPEPIAWLFLLLFITGLIFLIRDRAWPLAGFAALWLGLPVLLPIFLGDPRALQFRYAFVLPVYLVVIAYATVRLGGLIQSQKITRPASATIFLTWILATVSFIAVLNIYNQPKPNWRDAAAYLNHHTTAADIILIGPLWDEGRFIDYYYHGPAPLLTPAALVTNIERHADSMRQYGGRVWAVNRFTPTESPASTNVTFAGVVISEPTLAVYEPALLVEAAIDLARQAVAAAYPWAAEAEAQGVLNPDPRTAQAGALRALGDTLVAAGRPKEALAPYQTAVDSFPGWVNGYLALAETQESVGNLPAAVEAYRLAVKYNLEWHGPQVDEASALAKAGQWAEALAKYQQIIEE